MIVDPFKPLPPCTCGHSAYYHTAHGKNDRRKCSVMYGGKCPCEKYAAKEEPSGDRR